MAIGFRKKIKNKIVRYLLRYAHLLMEKHKIFIGAFLVLTLVALVFTVQLFKNVRTDFATLLPDNDRSVRHLRYILKRVGGVGTLFITISSPDFKANAQVVEELAKKIKKLPPDLITDFQYTTQKVQQFYQDYGLYYMDIDDLKKLRDLLAKRVSQARLAATGMLLEDSSRQISSEMEDIFQKYLEKNPYAYFPEGYLGTKTGNILVIMLRPSGTTNDLEFSKRLIDRLNGVIHEVNPQQYNKDIEVGITGAYRGLLENFSSIIMDAISTAGLTIFLVTLSIYLYYRNLRMIFMLSLAIIAGIAWTFAVTYFKIGYLNQQTAFLGSIIVGNGINFGLIQMARYLEERTRGVSVRKSISRSIIKTMSATGMAALTASLAYGVLSMTHFRGFSQFGFIGGVGMVLCWMASYLFLPPLLVYSEKLKPLEQSRLQKRRKHPISSRISKLVIQHYKALLWSLVVIIPFTLILSVKYVSKDQFEYNLKKLGTKSSFEKGMDLYYNKKLLQVLGNTASPAILLAPTREKANEYARLKVKEMKEAQKEGKETTLGQIQWLDGIYPEDQEKKAVILRQMRRIFPAKYLGLLSEKEKPWGSAIVRMMSQEPFKESDMPPVMRAAFLEQDGTLGRLVFFSAAKKVQLYNIHSLIKFGKDIEKNLPVDNDEARLASESMIFSDIVQNISQEGPVITFVSFILIGFLVFIGSSKIKDFLSVYISLALGMISFIAVLEAIGLKLNFFNFVVIPITIGIGVDYSINIYYRYKLEGRGSIGHVLTHTGGAVGLCSLTTMIGYGTMVIADNQSMASFGLMAMVGELILLTFAMLYMAAFLEYLDRKKKKLKN